MVNLIIWYLILTITGWITFPLSFRLLPSLPDHGYSFSRILGLLLWGYVFWVLASLGILQNNVGSILLAFTLLLGISLWTLWKTGLSTLKEWWLSHKRTLITVEVLFLAAFIAMAFIRSVDPNIDGTEKPMELAFINAILRSPTFPPHDPWLSGYAISYYYFGYVIVAMLAKLSAVPGNIAFNLALASVFALSAVGAYGLVYNLLSLRSKKNTSKATGYALLGPLFILIISNLEGFLHSLHSRGLFWQVNADGVLSSSFWTWLNIKDLNLPPTEPFSWVPEKFWWWWRASRVLQDYNYAGQPLEIIDEFPFFSFLLGDLHPHVLTIPFTFLGIALAFNIFTAGSKQVLSWSRVRLNVRTVSWMSVLAIIVGAGLLWRGYQELSLGISGIGLLCLIIAGVGIWQVTPFVSKYKIQILTDREIGTIELGVPIYLHPATLVLTGITVGGIAFMNTWDVIVAVALIAGAYSVGRLLSEDVKATFGKFIVDFILMSLVVGASGIILYLPFYIGFSSQAGGPLPNLIFPTRGINFWVMFAPLLIPLLVWLLYQLLTKEKRSGNSRSLLITVGLFLLLWIGSLILGLIIVRLPEIGGIEVGNYYLGFLAAPSSSALFSESIIRRLTTPGGWITISLLLFLTLSVLTTLVFQRCSRSGDKQTKEVPGETNHSTKSSKADIFVLLLILLGVLLTLGVEFFYMRDQFGWRMNTIFKFYYQTWLVWGIAAAYTFAVLLNTLRKTWRLALWGGVIVVLIMGLFYPVLSLWNKTNGFQPEAGLSFDGTAFLERRNPDEMEAINWLQSAPDGVVAEAVSPTGGSYQWPSYGRVSAMSGQPAVLGWMGHESQWRGGGDEMGTRQPDMTILYCSRDWDESKEILKRYNIRYVYVGSSERTTYSLGSDYCPTGIEDNKLEILLIPVFQNGSVTIYEVRGMEQ